MVSGSEVRISFFPGAGFDIEKIMDPDPVCIERLDPDLDPVNIRPDPIPWSLYIQGWKVVYVKKTV